MKIVQFLLDYIEYIIGIKYYSQKKCDLTIALFTFQNVLATTATIIMKRAFADKNIISV